MRCPRCQHTNTPQAKFCEECAAPLARACPTCGTQLSATAKFCPECAQPVVAGQVPETASAAPQTYTPKHLAEKILTSRSALEGEHKQVTILFCDIVDSSRPGRAPRSRSDARGHGPCPPPHGRGRPPLRGDRQPVPRGRPHGPLRRARGPGGSRAPGRPGGAGNPRDDQRPAASNSGTSAASELRLRLGPNTGLVVVGRIGDDLRMDYTAVGDTTHLAARMQALAEPGTILVTDATHRLVEGYVRSERLGPVAVKGRSDPVSRLPSDQGGGAGARGWT